MVKASFHAFKWYCPVSTSGGVLSTLGCAAEGVLCLF
jgi:hypothetical protein